MLILFKNNRVHDITFYTNPEAKFYPPHEITTEKKQLEGFRWRGEERPSKESVIGIQIEKSEIDTNAKELLIKKKVSKMIRPQKG